MFKGELLKLDYKKLDETTRLLKLALEAEELAVKVDLAEAVGSVCPASQRAPDALIEPQYRSLLTSLE